MEPAHFVVADHHLLEAGFIDRHDAVPEVLNLLAINVHTEHLDAHLSKAGAGDKTNVACSND